MLGRQSNPSPSHLIALFRGQSHPIAVEKRSASSAASSSGSAVSHRHSGQFPHPLSRPLKPINAFQRLLTAKSSSPTPLQHAMSTSPSRSPLLPGTSPSAQMDDGCPPTPVFRMVQSERNHLGVFRQNGMHRSTQVANPLPMNNPHLEDAALQASRQIIRHEILDLSRVERVQIQHAVYWKLNRLVHFQKDLILTLTFLTYSINITIRQAGLSDVAVIADFNLRLAQETEDLHLDPQCVAIGVAAILQDTSKGLYYIAEIDGAVAGQVMITYEWSDWRNGNLWWLQSVYVRKEFRQMGVFRALFQYLRDAARARQDVAGLRLYMHAENARARESYQRLGMKPTKYQV